MEKHSANAQRIAEELLAWKQIRDVIYSGIDSHQGHALARHQMRAFGGMVSVRLHGGEPAARRFCSRLRLIACAESLGGVESLCSHPAPMTHASIPADVRESHGITGDLIRWSVGIEDIADIQTDLDQALRASQE
jgi:cystathionine gamma-lyase